MQYLSMNPFRMSNSPWVLSGSLFLREAGKEIILDSTEYSIVFVQWRERTCVMWVGVEKNPHKIGFWWQSACQWAIITSMPFSIHSTKPTHTGRNYEQAMTFFAVVPFDFTRQLRLKLLPFPTIYKNISVKLFYIYYFFCSSQWT